MHLLSKETSKTAGTGFLTSFKLILYVLFPNDSDSSGSSFISCCCWLFAIKLFAVSNKFEFYKEEVSLIRSLDLLLRLSKVSAPPPNMQTSVTNGMLTLEGTKRRYSQWLDILLTALGMMELLGALFRNILCWLVFKPRQCELYLWWLVNWFWVGAFRRIEKPRLFVILVFSSYGGDGDCLISNFENCSFFSSKDLSIHLFYSENYFSDIILSQNAVQGRHFFI